MKRFYGTGITFFFLLMLQTAKAQSTLPGIKFQGISFAQALQQAGKSGRLVFIDCYTSWCAPCKWMEKNVFINDTVYNFYNKNFVNLKIDMEEGEGLELRKRYKVESFPTYLFVNEKGDVVHRTASKMEVKEFFDEGKKAVEPSANYAFLMERYIQGDRSNDLLFNYVLVLGKIDRSAAQKVEEELISKITDAELSTEFGWEVINKLARNENDRLGKYLLGHKDHFKVLIGEAALNTVVIRLGMSTMYQLIREKNDPEFFRHLEQMRSNPDNQIQRNLAKLEMEYYLEANKTDSFVAAADRARNGVLIYNDFDLSFAARRAHYMARNDPKILQQALVMARRAVELNPEEYSNQGTLASICLDLKLKEEGLRAARHARRLAEESTSKIQKLAQELVDKLEKL